jgi:hypothetical protein
MEKVSFVCTTYRRFRCVERILYQYYAQSYANKELIILNTDDEYPIVKDFDDDSVIVINNNIDYLTGEQYTNRGSILTDATTYASGSYFMLADDDDIYLPWHIQQAVDGILSNAKDSWKPQKSLFAIGDEIKLCQNTLEASVIVKMDRIKEIGFRTDTTGYEGLSWYTKLRDEGNLDEYNSEYVPSYCFNWSDPADMSGHKQSGNIDSPTNFDDHKSNSKDIATRPLSLSCMHNYKDTYNRYFDWFTSNKHDINTEYYDKYAKSYIEQ